MEIVNEEQPSTEKAEQTPDALVGIKEPVEDRLDDLANFNASLGAIPDVTVGEEHKNAFLDCLVTGDRYREKVSLYGGRITVTIRSRTIEETDAIMSYLQHLAASKLITSDYEYSSALRLAMLAAQVERFNDIEYPPLKHPLFATDKGAEVDPPAWVADLEVWKSKSEAVIAAIGTEISKFEARYWAMIRASGAINFWQPGESTGH